MRIHQGAPQFLESRGFAGTGRSADAHRAVTRLEDEFNSVLLLRAQTVRDGKPLSPAEGLECAESAVDGSDHVSFAFQTGRRCDFPTRAQDASGGFLETQLTLQVSKPDSSPAMPQGLREQFVVRCDGHALEDVVNGVVQ